MRYVVQRTRFKAELRLHRHTLATVQQNLSRSTRQFLQPKSLLGQLYILLARDALHLSDEAGCRFIRS